MTKECFECCSTIPYQAHVCPVCAERIEGKQCPDCMTLSPVEAKVCRYCRHKFRAEKGQVTFDNFTVTANFLATILLRGSIFPQEASFAEDKIIITTYGFLGLSSHDEEIPWEKVAGFSHRSGILWDLVSIETRGQTACAIACLTKADALRIRKVLQEFEK